MSGPLFFGVAGEMLDALVRIGRTPRAIVIRLDRVPYVDSSGVQALETFVRQAKAGDTRVVLCDMSRPVWETLARSHPRFAGAERTRSFEAALARLAKPVT